MHTKGSMKLLKVLDINQYVFWEALYLYHEMGDLFWNNSAKPVNQLTEAELKMCFFNCQPKTWQQQFLGSPRPDTMPLEELKDHNNNNNNSMIIVINYYPMRV